MFRVNAILLSLLLSFTTAQAAPAKNAGYLQDPFNFAAKTLPTGFLGHNPVQIYEALSARNSISKGRYETTPQFEQRRGNLLARPLFGKVYLGSSIAFVVRP